MVQDVGSQSSNTEGLNGSTSPIIQRKLELDKVCVSACLSVVFVFLLVYVIRFAHKAVQPTSPKDDSNSCISRCLKFTLL